MHYPGESCRKYHTYHMRIKLLLGCFWQTSQGFGCQEVTLCVSQPLLQILDFTMEPFGLQWLGSFRFVSQILSLSSKVKSPSWFSLPRYRITWGSQVLGPVARDLRTPSRKPRSAKRRSAAFSSALFFFPLILLLLSFLVSTWNIHLWLNAANRHDFGLGHHSESRAYSLHSPGARRCPAAASFDLFFPKYPASVDLRFWACTGGCLLLLPRSRQLDHFLLCWPLLLWTGGLKRHFGAPENVNMIISCKHSNGTSNACLFFFFFPFFLAGRGSHVFQANLELNTQLRRTSNF